MVFRVHMLLAGLALLSLSEQGGEDVVDGAIRQHNKVQLQTNFIPLFSPAKRSDQEHDCCGPYKKMVFWTSLQRSR